MTCTRSDYNIEVLLAYKYKNGTSGEKEVYLKGRDVKGVREVDFSKIIDGVTGRESHFVRHQNSWNLKVYKSGTTRFSNTDDDYWVADFDCDSRNVFIVKEQSHNYMDGDWENPVTSLKLALDRCSTDPEGKEICEIKIEDGVGLQWNPSFKPKAIFR